MSLSTIVAYFSKYKDAVPHGKIYKSASRFDKIKNFAVKASPLRKTIISAAVPTKEVGRRWAEFRPKNR